MASVLLQRLEFIRDNTYGTFVEGDILEIYADTALLVVPAFLSSTGITVNLNGSPLGVTVAYPNSDDYISTNYTTQVCVSTELVVFTPGYIVWPYMTYYSLADHYSCQVNPPTCDLMVVGIPAVVPSTDDTTADGSFIVIASSTNPIQYKIGSDFVYGDGSGQITGEFTALLKGSYRVYMRDSANCFATVLVEIPVSNTYGEKFVMEYTDQNGNLTKNVISRRGYTDASQEICGGNQTIILGLTGATSENKFEPLASISADVQLLSDTDFKFVELYTNDPNLYRLYHYKDVGSGYELKYIGKGLPQRFEELFKAPPYYSRASFTDGLAELKEYFLFQGDGNKYFGTISLLQLICHCLNKLKLDINILVAANLYATGMENGVDNVPLDLDEFQTRSVGANIDWTEGVNPTVSVTLQTSEILYLDFNFMEGYEYEITLNYDFAASGTSSISISMLDDSFNVIDGINEIVSTTGTSNLVLTTTATALSTKIGIVASGSVTVTLNSISYLKTTADALDQAYIDFECFYLAEERPTLDFVMRAILEPFNARLIQWNGRWNILRVEELVDDVEYRLFDKNGVYLSAGTLSPVNDLDFDSNPTDLIFVNGDQNLELKPGYGALKVLYHLGLKPNIITNGDFRYKSTYIPDLNTYSLALDKTGFTLVNAGYALLESVEQIDKNNIAWIITGDADTTGEAYIQTDTYNVLMGTSNQLKISLTVKFPITVALFGFPGNPDLTELKIEVPYVKLRVRVKYGSLYLTSNGTWSSTPNELVFFVEEFNKYVTFEIVAKQPTTGTPSTGMDFDIRVYHTFAYWAQFTEFNDLRAFDTYDSGAVDPYKTLIANGFRTEVRSGDFSTGPQDEIYYYELEENTDAESAPLIVRPSDYHATNNPRQWVSKGRRLVGTVDGANVHSLVIDKIQVQYLTNNNDSIDTIVRSISGESGNNRTLEKNLYIGSYSTLIVTDYQMGIDLGIFFPGTSGSLNSTTSNTLSADLIYTGWLRSESGVGYEFWARPGIAESDKLHGIFLKTLAAQYKRSWRMMRGSFKYQGSNYFDLFGVWRNVNYNNRIFLPSSLQLNDLTCQYSGESLELANIYADPGSDGSSEAPYSSAFSIGYGADFN